MSLRVNPDVDAEILFHSLAGFYLSNEDPIHPRPDEATTEALAT